MRTQEDEANELFADDVPENNHADLDDMEGASNSHQKGSDCNVGSPEYIFDLVMAQEDEERKRRKEKPTDQEMHSDIIANSSLLANF